jgi:predicted transcriptional regulator
MPKALTIEIDEETEKKLRVMAKSTTKTESEIVVDAVRDYVNRRENYIRMIEEGIKDAEAGRVVTHEALMEELEGRLARLG